METDSDRTPREDEVPDGLRRASRKRVPLKLGEKLNIVYRALVKFETYATIAKHHRISVGVVSHLVN